MPQTIAALRAGKHVLCEKPMALHYAEALGMQQAAVETGRTLGVAYYRRMYPKVARAKDLMESGAIGRPVFAEATSHDWFYPADGFRAWLVTEGELDLTPLNGPDRRAADPRACEPALPVRGEFRECRAGQERVAVIRGRGAIHRVGDGAVGPALT